MMAHRISTSDLSNARDRVNRVLIEKTLLPLQVFHPAYRNYRFAPIDLILGAAGWADLQTQMRCTSASGLVMGVVDPDPVYYFAREFGVTQWWALDAATTVDQYLDILWVEPPNGNEADSVRGNSEIVVWIANDASFAVYGDRSHECAVIAFRDIAHAQRLGSHWQTCSEFLDSQLMVPSRGADAFLASIQQNYRDNV